MQQVKYPQLNIQEAEQYQQQEQQSQIINSNQYAKQNNPDMIFIPVVVNQNSDTQQQQNTIYQPILPYQNQVQPYTYNYNPNQPNQSDNNQNIPLIEKEIKDLDFGQQKMYFLKITGLFFLWSCFYSLLMIILIGIFANSMYDYRFIYPFLLIFSVIITFILNNNGIQKKNRNNAGLTFFVTIIFYTLIFFSLIGSISTDITNQLTINVVVALGVFTAQSVNFITTVVMLFYLLIETQRINIGKFVGLVILAILIIFMAFFKYFYLLFFYLPLSLPYAFLLPNSLLQITKGRFQLQKDQVFSGALAVNYALIVFCGQEV